MKSFEDQHVHYEFVHKSMPWFKVDPFSWYDQQDLLMVSKKEQQCGWSLNNVFGKN
jgi:hypothetical protein